MRLIDADALVVDLEKRYTYEMADGRNKAYGKGVRDAIKDIWDTPTVGGWISVEDRLPETNDEVLTTYIVNGNKTKRFVEAASYCGAINGEGFWTSPWDEFIVPGTRQEVIAWMPMPKPYKPPEEG